MPSLDRLSALDAAFLDLDTPRAPLHVGWTMRFEGGAPSLSELRRRLEARLERVPRLRRRLARTPAGRAWVDDAAFDVARHICAVSVPAPGRAGELRDTAGALLGRALDPARPLWRLYLVGGLADGGFAVVGQAHHALVDGIAAVELAMLLFDGAAPDAPDRRWRPVAPPSASEAALQAVSAHVRGGARALAILARAAAHPGSSAMALREASTALGGVLAPAPATALDRSVTARRTLGFAAAPLEDVRAAGHRRGATVNDVLLAAACLALGRALHRHGDHPAGFKALVPVNLRESSAGGLGNAISFMPVELPVGESDPVAVLRTVRDRTRAAKASGAAGPFAALTSAGDVLPGRARRAVARAAARAAPFNAVVSNVPGPPVELDLLGRRLAAVHPAVPLLEGHALSIGALSYAGRLNVGLCADAAVLPDVVDVARDLESAFDVLRLAPERARPAVTPWRERARDRRERVTKP